MNKFIIVTGNPVAGFFYHGSFDTSDDAMIWAEDHQAGQDWWIAELHSPDEEV